MHALAEQLSRYPASLVAIAVELAAMGKYLKGDHVKFEVVDDHSGECEWLWLSVQRSDDESGIVFGRLDSQPIIITDMKLGQELAVSYDRVRDHRRFTKQESK